MIFREMDFGVFNEVFTATEFDSTTNKKEKYTLNDFASVANYCPGPVKLMQVYAENKVSWPKNKYTSAEKYIALPNEIVETKIADCLDHTIFARTFCNFRKIQNNIIFISVVNRKTKELMAGHAVLAYKGNKIREWFIWNYEFEGYGSINGPFKTLESAALEYSGYYLVSHSNIGIKDGYSDVAKQKLAAALEPNELKIIDKIVAENTKITQAQLLNKMNTITDLNKELMNNVDSVSILEQINKNKFKKKSFIPFILKPNLKNIGINVIRLAKSKNMLRYVFDKYTNTDKVEEF